MKQIASGITGADLLDSAPQNETGLRPGGTGSGTAGPVSEATQARRDTVTRCLQRLNLSRIRRTSWSAQDMAKPEMLRPIWTLDGDPSLLRQALSSTCSQAESAQLVTVMRNLCGLSWEQKDRAEGMVRAYVAKLADYPPLVATEVVRHWTDTEEFFPRSWSLLKARLDAVRSELEALAK